MHRLRGRLLRFAVLGYLAGLVLGYGAGASFKALGWVSQPLLIAIILLALLVRSLPVLLGLRANGPRPTVARSYCRPPRCRSSSPPRRSGWCKASSAR